MKKRHIILSTSIILLTTAILVILFGQDRIVLQAVALPSNYQFQFDSAYEEFFFEKEAVKINALLFRTEQKPSKGLVFYLHGNADNLQRHAKRYSHFTEKGYDIFMMDYRSYGKSRGITNEAVFHEDVQWIFEEALKICETTAAETIVYGRSLGTGMASKLASKQQVKTLILETPYSKIADVPNYYFPFLPYDKFLKYTFRTCDWLNKVSCNTYIIHGTKDWIVPYKSGHRLKSVMSNANHFITIKGGHHNNLPTFSAYHHYLNLCLEDNL
ncbi:MAG: alpha/beta hydrolase [Chitinophagales bacterium]